MSLTWASGGGKCLWHPCPAFSSPTNSHAAMLFIAMFTHQPQRPEVVQDVIEACIFLHNLMLNLNWKHVLMRRQYLHFSLAAFALCTLRKERLSIMKCHTSNSPQEWQLIADEFKTLMHVASLPSVFKS